MGLFGKSKEKKSKKLFEKGGKLWEQEKYEEAIACFDEAFQINPKFFGALLRKGLTLSLNLKRYDEGISCFDEVIRLNPQNDLAWDYKGQVLKVLGRNEEAELCLSKSNKSFVITPSICKSNSCIPSVIVGLFYTDLRVRIKNTRRICCC